MRKKIKGVYKASATKKAKFAESPESYYGKTPVWSFRMVDSGYKKWGLLQDKDLYKNVIEKMKFIEGMTWDEIIKSTGGRRTGNNNHFIRISGLTHEAQKRWQELHLEEYDQVFSLRLDGKKRLFGLIDDGVFSVVWYDQNHEICPIAN